MVVVAGTGGPGLLQAIQHQRAVGQAGQLVEEGQILDALPCLLELADIVVSDQVKLI
jgi:hypothetical protein